MNPEKQGFSTSTNFILVALGSHVIELIRENPVNLVGVLDVRKNGCINNLDVSSSPVVYGVGSESKKPFLSYWENQNYYREIKRLLDQHNDCKVIISGNHYPLARFIIDYAGLDRVELWEDGLHHYVKLEQTSLKYYFRCFLKLLCGYYPRHIFDAQYQANKLVTRDRFKHCNLNFKRFHIRGEGKYYIGQPLIEDGYIGEGKLQRKLKKRFMDRKMIYLPHFRELNRPWLKDIFDVIETKLSAERYIMQHGAAEVHSASSTVNLNVECKKNVYHCNYLGLKKITKELKKYDFGVDIQ